MRRRTALSLATAGALALSGIAAPAAAAATGSVTTAIDDAIAIWDDDTGQIIQVTDELFGRLVVVPGSHHVRTLRVQNAGPSDGTLTVAIVNAVAQRGGDGWVDDSFYDDLTINTVPVSALDGVETPVTTEVLAQGATTTVAFDVDFPYEATSGNAAHVGERVFSFDVRLTISGDTPDEPTPSPTPAPEPTPTGTGEPSTAPTTGTGAGTGGTGGTISSGAKPAGTSGLASQTGGVAPELSVPLLLAAAAAAAAAATLTVRALATARRRRAKVTVHR